MDVGGWLRGLGLGQYEAAFRENAIDDMVLPNLTAEDLKDLGVGIVGHRRKLLDAIAALRADANTKALSSDALAETDRPPKESAERRQVTVMFSDLVGSTALSARMDPEDLREVVGAYHRCASESVRRVGGFVSQYLGDGVLAYFGYPLAHEDDAERAVRAGLDLIAAVAALKTRTALQTRVGIATGLVLVGDVVDAGGPQERGIIGETPNLAARLQGIAQPNTVVIAESTRRLLGDLFEFQDLGARELKGVAGPVRAWAALHARSVESRFEALHASGLTTLVGREEETEIMLRRWSRANSGEGQVLLLSGEAGIGKSRLTAALLEHLAGEPHMRLRYFCSPQHSDSALHPIIGQLERAAGLAHDDNPQTRLNKLNATLTQTSTSLRDAALFAEMLSLPNDGRYPSLDLSPEQRRQGTLDALITQLDTLAGQNPVLMIFEDAHWVDPTSLEVLGRVVDRIRSLRVLLIVTFRPEFEPPWIGQPHVTALTINRLTHREIGLLIDNVVGNKMLPAGIRHDIIERTDGIPLFIEEMTKTVLESGILRDAGHQYELTGAMAARAIPSTLHGSLLARIDRLPTGKAVAQVASALGGTFSYRLLAAVAGLPEQDLNTALAQLVGAELLMQRGIPPGATYVFKHALVQDAAYASLLRSNRQKLHARIAGVIEGQFSDLAANAPETLAQHHAEAAAFEQAISYWSKAARRSLGRSAMMEATLQFGKALSLIAELPKGADRDRQELALQTGLGLALTATKGYAAPETGQAYARGRRLCEELNDTAVLVRVGYGEYLYYLMRGEARHAHQVATDIRSLSERIDNDNARVLGHRILGVSLFERGDLEGARQELETAAKLLEKPRQEDRGRRDREAELMIVTWLGYVLAFQGYLDQACRARASSLAQGNASRALHWRCFTMGFSGGISMLLREYDRLLRTGETLFALTNEHKFLQHESTGLLQRGYAGMFLGDADAEPLIQEGLAIYRRTGAKWALPCWLGTYADALLQHGKDAMPVLREAFNAVEVMDEHWYEPELYRLRGNIALCGSPRDENRAENDYCMGKQIAEQQQSKLLELRAAVSLAKLYCGQGRHTDARDVLAPVYAWFKEGFEAADLKDAKGLLDHLARG